jgi:hypothetical protein
MEAYFVHLERYLKFDAERFLGITAAVAQLVDALRYKPAGRGFDSRLT